VNVEKTMSAVADTIRRKVANAAPERLWTFRDFASLPSSAVAMSLSRLAKEGVVHRLRNGVYYKPKVSRFGTLKPDPANVVAVVLDRKNVDWKPSGLSVWNAMGLTTQIAATPTFTADHRVRVTAPNSRVRVSTAPTVRGLSVEERASLDALRDLRRVPDTTPEATIRRLVELCREGRLSFARMLRVAKSEPPRVRALLGLIGALLGEPNESLDPLHRSLNPLTVFRLGLSGAFPDAGRWNIR
jgi:hypothetical protein